MEVQAKLKNYQGLIQAMDEYNDLMEEAPKGQDIKGALQDFQHFISDRGLMQSEARGVRGYSSEAVSDMVQQFIESRKR